MPELVTCKDLTKRFGNHTALDHINISLDSGKIIGLLGPNGSGKTTLLNYLLSNREGIKFAVIVNDIGEINIDAELIQKDGIVGQKEESLVALQNGFVC